MTMTRKVLYETGITATAGIGTNREMLWCHTLLTDFWQIGSGVAKRVAALGCQTMGDIARLITQNEDVLYDALGSRQSL